MNKTMKITLDGIDISKLFYSVTNIKRNIGSNWVNTTSPRLQGAEFLYNALGSKTISFDYIIDGVFFEEINAKKELLAKYLNVKEPVPLIFNDEPNKVWYVVPDGEQSFEQATGTITFLVPKGYAESVYTKVLNNDNSGGENGTIINNADHSVSVLINNNGTLPIYPTIKVTPTSETGYLAFVGQNVILEIGNPDEADTTTAKSQKLVSDGTVILSGTEYYWSGTNWILSEINAHNINGDNLNVTNGKFTDGVIETSWKNGTVAGSTNIENDHLIITRTDSSVNTTNSIGLDSTQGLIMVYTENSTGRTISVGTNFQGMSLTDSTGISASISPAGVKLSSDVNWTQIGNIGGRRAEWKRENNRVTMNIHGGNGDGFPVITSGGTLLGILPTNARPPSDISMPATAQGAGATAQISINSTGEVRCYRWGRDSVYFGAYISYYVE
ncbi:phage tail family protein [Lactococcus lactis]|uniref:distal tail protein Dit n=5 Tax=Lactococcus lactis TaxID=1358 RepID=UPI0020746ECF|nr:phage tail family protein [Lactococcus lactis]MCM6852223.1 phage tail family protein [Lactococcus lactis]